jgi:hypothetical protein
LQLLDPVIFLGQLALIGKIEISEHQAAKHNARPDEYRWQRRARVYGPPCRLWPLLSKKVYADHG